MPVLRSVPSLRARSLDSVSAMAKLRMGAYHAVGAYHATLLRHLLVIHDNRHSHPGNGHCRFLREL